MKKDSKFIYLISFIGSVILWIPGPSITFYPPQAKTIINPYSTLAIFISPIELSMRLLSKDWFKEYIPSNL